MNKDYIKNLWLFNSPQGWKILIILGAGIFLMVFAGSFNKNESIKRGEPETMKIASENISMLQQSEEKLETRLKNILGAIAGAGRVEVALTLSSSPEQIYAQNINKDEKIVEENDSARGIKTTTEINEQDDFVLLQGNGTEGPVIIREERPEIIGVLVLSEGAGDPEIKEKLARAVETVLSLPAHKVTVLPREGE